jgi:outer membrane cobalamin receptor
MKKNVFLIMIAAVIISKSGFSQQNKSTLKDTIALGEVVVTGTPVRVNKNNVPMAVSVVTRQQISESDESALLPVLNGLVPGLFVSERGITGFGVSNGAAGQITIRGIGEDPTTGVLLLIDGHPQFMGIFGHPLSDSYVASDVERVEVIRGPASILYGSNAMGGVINIITHKQTQEGFHGNVRFMYGSYNTQKYMASGGYKRDKFSVFASVNHDQTDGHRPHSDFNITNGYVKLGYKINNNLKTNADFSIAKFKAADPGLDTINAIYGPTQNITRGYWSFSLDNDYEKYSGTIKAFYNFGTHHFSDGFNSNDADYGLNISESAKLFKGNSITFGGDYTNYGGKATQDIGGGNTMTFVDTTVYEVGVYGFVQQTLFKKLTLNAGIRLQDNEFYGKAWIPSGGFAYSLATTTWKASVGKGFRSPTLRELFMWNHNPELDPEKVINYETSILQSFFTQKINLELTGYIVTGDNLIVTGDMGQLYNGGEINNKGIEFAANVIPVKNLSVNLTYSYINMRTPVYATPKNHLFLSASYKWNKLQFTASVQQINHLNTVADPSLTPYFQNYTLLNSKISFQVLKYIEIFASGNNLLNQKYETNRYYPMPGTTFFGGLNFKF